MLRLLSNKEPTKQRSDEPSVLSEVISNQQKEASTKKFEQRGLSHCEETTSKPNPYFTASEYWKYIMRFGRRKMTRDEWEIWNEKKQQEEKARYKEWREIKFGY